MKKHLIIAALAALALAACGEPASIDTRGESNEDATVAAPDTGGSTETDTGNGGGGGTTCDPKDSDCDGDGFVGQKDCAPYNGKINPDADEVCGNDVDENCNGDADDVCKTTATPTDDDGDGVVTPKDCDDDDANVHPYTDEVCGNNVDDNCNSKIDEGCSGTPTEPTSDDDGDGYPKGPDDCDDGDDDVHPNAKELCDGVDNNCDGNKDEGCSNNPEPPAAGKTLKVKVCYSTAMHRVLSVQYLNHSTGQVGKWWHVNATSNDKCVEVTLSSAQFDLGSALCGLRLNVAEGEPANDWLCIGNGSTAMLDPTATVEISIDGKVMWTKSNLLIWSAPGGTSAGCSGFLLVSSTSNPGCLQ